MMKRFGRIKLFTKIYWIFLAVSLIPLLIIAMTSYHQFSRTLNQHIRDKLIAISDGRQNFIENSLTNILMLAVEKSQSPTLVTAFEKLDADFKRPGIKNEELKLIASEYDYTFQRYFDANDYLYDVLFISNEGNIIFSVTNESDFGKNINDPILKNTALFKAVASANTYLSARISDFDIYPPSNQPALFTVTPVFSKNRLLGTLALQFKPEMLHGFSQNYTGLTKTGDVTFAKRVGDEVVFTTPTRFKTDAAFNYRAKFGSGTAIPEQKALRGEAGIGITTDYRGKQVLARWQYIPLLRWGMVIKEDLDDAFQPIYQLRNLYIIVFVLLTLLLLVISYMVARTISTPIETVRSGLKVIGGGNLEHKIDIKRSDEIGDLAGDINMMARSLKQSREKVLRSEKLATIGQLASSVAHELRNPLGVMKNAVYYLNMLGLGKDGPDIKENMDIISGEIENSSKIIDDLLEFSHIKHPVLKQEDINLIIRETLSRIRTPADIKVVTELDENIPRIEVDALQIQQIFYNLATNAIQAMEKGGILVVSSRATNDGYVAVAIKDTGCGIPKENLQKIFDPLFSTKTKGTGLGLSVAASLLEGHEGKIEVESPSTLLGAGEVAKGSIFTVKLPMVRGGA